MNEWIGLAGRILLSFVFVMAAAIKIIYPGETEVYMANYGVPFSLFFMRLAIFVELAGGISLLIGYKAKLGAVLLVVFLIPVTLIFHTQFDGQLQLQQLAMFLKNIAIIGGLLQVISFGPGAISWDSYKKKTTDY